MRPGAHEEGPTITSVSGRENDRPRLSVGCAMWTLPSWSGRYTPARAAPGAALASYASWCNAVEGNTTFYALPTTETVTRWRDATPAGFEFCFKVPRSITHDRRLRRSETELEQFVDRLSPLRDRMGPIWIQLPPSFGPRDLPVLGDFLRDLPDGWAWAVEVRHRDFEAEGPAERELNDLLYASGVDRVVIDTRAVFSGPRETAAEIEAFERKPRLRVRPIALHDRPTVRFIGRTAAAENPEFWRPWVDKVGAWLREGRRPMVFLHTPDNAVAPDLARAFHAEVAASVPELAPLPEPDRLDTQLDIFGATDGV